MLQGATATVPKPNNRINDSDRPDEAFTTDRAVRNGRANAASGRIKVNIPGDHFGPILPEHDPETGRVSWLLRRRSGYMPRLYNIGV